MLYLKWDVLLPRFERSVLFKRPLSPSAVAIFLAGLVVAHSGARLVVFAQGAEPVGESELRSFATNWKNETGVADSVRRMWRVIVSADTPDDHAAIEAATSEIVENSPTSDITWQELAEVRLARGASMDSALAAFRMSQLVGSHEGNSMIQRAIFGLEHWAMLPQADRRIVVRDLVTTTEDNPTRLRYRAILAAKSQVERDDIRAAVMASGLATPQATEALGE
jgi:hypothetical protein